jgi:UTP--glucose-1-phosphate uridylyltransferase
MPSDLHDPLERLPASELERLLAAGLDRARFKEHVARVRSETPEDNFVRGAITPPTAGDVEELPPAGSAEYRALEELGKEALSKGQAALIVLAGGMATRMGGVIKALVEALPGHTFLDLRLNEARAHAKRYGVQPPLWIMTSEATNEGIQKALAGKLDGDRIATFQQSISARLTPEGDLFLGDDGQPSAHAPGHGDLPDALKRSGLVQRFVAGGGKVVMMTNLDNLGGSLDPVLIGYHLSHGAAVTAEVVDKLGSDRGGIPVRVDGRICILEEFRIPPSFDPATVRVFATNVFTFDAPTLATLEMPWTFFRVTKKVDGRPAIQFERLVNEVSSHLPTRYLKVPRSGAGSRFLPVKDNDELEARRAENELVAKTRGMLP